MSGSLTKINVPLTKISALLTKLSGSPFVMTWKCLTSRSSLTHHEKCPVPTNEWLTCKDKCPIYKNEHSGHENEWPTHKNECPAECSTHKIEWLIKASHK